MLYILIATIVFCALLCAAELLVRLADSTGVMDKLFRLFDLPAKKESASNAATSEGTKVICIGDIIPQYDEVVKEEMR